MSGTARVTFQPRILSRTAFSALIFLLAAVAVSGVSLLSGILLVVLNGSVIPGWQLGSGLLVPALGLSVVAIGLSYRANVSARGPGRVRAEFSDVFYSRKALIWLGVGCGLFNLLMAGADTFNGFRYVVLKPSGAGECRIVVRQSSFFEPGVGVLYRVPGDWGLAVRESQQQYDVDAYGPFFAGQYRLTWDGSSGQLRATSDRSGSGEPIPVSCPQ
jgi:hypothetical protein